MDLAAARYLLVRQRPYLAAALFRLQLVPLADLPTVMGVDQYWRLYYRPEAELPVPEVAGCLYHEVLHLLWQHHERVGPRDRHRWNIATDLEINSRIAKESVQLPNFVLQPEQFNLPAGLLAEEYYDRLPQLPPVESSSVGAGDCGSGADGHRRPYELDPQAEPPGLSEAAQRAVRHMVASAVQQASQGKARGVVPEYLRRWAEEVLDVDVRLSWQQLLRGRLRRWVGYCRGLVDFSYRYPRRRRQLQPEVILPGLVRPQFQIAVVVDTSGSVSERELAAYLEQVETICRQTGQSVTVLAVDAQVHNKGRVVRGRQARRLLKGGGGTDMGVGIAAALQLTPKPGVIVVCTDGYTPWPPDPPEVPVIVLTTGNQGPEWATTISLR